MTTKKETPPSRVRARALVHMQRILATSAAAMAATETACHPKDKTSDAGSDATAFGPPTADAGSTALDPDATVVSERNHGYAVVDPMPRPAHCPDIAAHIKATATKSGDNIVVRLNNAGGYSSFKYEKSQTPIVYNGTYVKHALEASGTMVVTLTPTGGVASVSVKGTCTKGTATIHASVGPDLNVIVNEW